MRLGAIVLLGALVLVTLPLVVARAAGRPQQAAVAASKGALSAKVLAVDDAVFAGDRWYVVDGRSDRIHMLDSTGALRGGFGRTGGGPGEFRAPQFVAATMGQVIVADLQRPQLSVFSRDGKFLKYLKPAGGCAQSGVAQLAAHADAVYLLRRCWDGRSAVRYQLERSNAQGELAVLPFGGDTVRLQPSQPLPFHVALLSVSSTQLVVGDGVPGCVRIYALATGSALGRRCFNELPRRPISKAERARLTRRWQGRIGIPDSLPRLRALVWQDSIAIVQAVESSETASWLIVPGPAPSRSPRLLRAGLPSAFAGNGTLLVAHEDAAGVRIEVARVR